MSAQLALEFVGGSALPADGVASQVGTVEGFESPAPDPSLVLDGPYPFLGFVDLSGTRRTVLRLKGGRLGVSVWPRGYALLASGTRWQPARMVSDGWVETGPERVVP